MFSTKACPRSSINISNLDRKRLSVVILPKGGFTKKKKKENILKNVTWSGKTHPMLMRLNSGQKSKKDEKIWPILFFFFLLVI